VSTHYSTLGVSESASAAEITAAYRKLMRRYHPDLNAGTDEIASRVTLAYSTLSDGQKRAEYDRTLAPVFQQYNPEPVIKVSEPILFEKAEPLPRGMNKRRRSVFRKAWATVGGRVLISLTAASLIAWVASIVLGVNSLGGTPLGLSSFVIGLFILTLLVLVLNPIKHPWITITLLLLMFAVPIDYINGDNLLPNLLDGLTPVATVCIIVAYVGAVGAKVFWVRTRQIP